MEPARFRVQKPGTCFDIRTAQAYNQRRIEARWITKVKEKYTILTSSSFSSFLTSFVVSFLASSFFSCKYFATRYNYFTSSITSYGYRYSSEWNLPVKSYALQSLKQNLTSCARGRHNMPRPCKLTFDLLILKVVSESRVTWATSVPILVFLWGLSVLELGPMYATDRQTDRQTYRLQTDVIRASSLNASYSRGGGITINLITFCKKTSPLKLNYSDVIIVSSRYYFLLKIKTRINS